MLDQGRPFLINCLTLKHDSTAAGWPSVLSIANPSDYSLAELPQVDYLLRPWSVGVADVALVSTALGTDRISTLDVGVGFQSEADVFQDQAS